jgi:hypothetical protein
VLYIVLDLYALLSITSIVEDLQDI